MHTDERKRRAGSTPPREQTTKMDVERADFANSVMRQIRAELQSEFTASLDRAVDRISCNLLAKLEEVQSDVETVKTDIKAVATRVDERDREVDERLEVLQKEIAALRDEARDATKAWPTPSASRWNRAGSTGDVRLPASSTASTSGRDAWDKTPDDTIIRVNTSDAVGVDDITKALQDLVASMEVGDYKVVVTSPGSKRLATRWIMSFPQLPDQAGAVERVLSAMRGPDGWRRPVCKTPIWGRHSTLLGGRQEHQTDPHRDRCEVTREAVVCHVPFEDVRPQTDRRNGLGGLQAGRESPRHPRRHAVGVQHAGCDGLGMRLRQERHQTTMGLGPEGGRCVVEHLTLDRTSPLLFAEGSRSPLGMLRP